MLIAALFAAVSAATRAVNPSARASHATILTRPVLGPLDAISADARVQLEASINVAPNDARAPGIPVGEKVLLTFRVHDLNGKPLPGLTPRIETKLLGAPASSDPFDLQELFVLTSATGDVGIIAEDDHAAHTPGRALGRAVGSNFSAMLALTGAASDAVMDRDHRYIFVTLPGKDAVAVIDASSHRVIEQINVGKKPHHIAIESSGKRVWVANDGDGTVSAIETATHRAQTIRVGAGHHEFAFAAESGLVFVSNHQANTVSVIHAEQARVIAEVAVGDAPHGLEYAARRLYVANEGAGTISVLNVEGERVAPIATINAGAGTRQVRIDATGHVGVASNMRANTLTLFNPATNTVIKTIQSGGGPDSIVFLGNYAIVRNALTPNATFVHLDMPDIADNIVLGDAPALTKLATNAHARLFVNGAGDRVLIPGSVEGQIYRLHIMDGRPMAMSQTKVTQGADLILSLVNDTRETSPGVYQRIARFDRAGAYTLTIANADKLLAQFTLNIVSTKNVKPWNVELISPMQPYVARQQVVVQFRVVSTQAGATQIADGVIRVYRFVPGQVAWQWGALAEYVGDNIYQAKMEFPEAGTYSITFNSLQSDLTAADSPRATVPVTSP